MDDRRAYAGRLIGQALLAAARGSGHRRIALDLDIQAGTVRGWIRPAWRRPSRPKPPDAARADLHLDPERGLPHHLDGLSARQAITARNCWHHPSGDTVLSLALAGPHRETVCHRFEANRPGHVFKHAKTGGQDQSAELSVPCRDLFGLSLPLCLCLGPRSRELSLPRGHASSLTQERECFPKTAARPRYRLK